VILLAAVQFCFGQEKPRAVLVDKFDQLICENMEARFDQLFIELQNDPSSTGYVVIYSGEKSFRKRFLYEIEFISHLKWRKFSTERIKVIHLAEGDRFGIELWKVPRGADDPFSAHQEVEYSLASLTKATVFGNKFSEGCFTFDAELYSNYLKANPLLRGNIVVYEKSPGKARKSGKDTVNKLVKKFHIARDRLRVFYGNYQEYFLGYSDVEYWLVPVKKKQ